MKQPYIYTLPEQFIDDPSVPLHWKLYTLINGFWIGGKPVFASNHFFAEKLKCSERHIRSCLEKLEEMSLLERVGKSQNRRIIPKGGTPTSSQGGTHSSVRAEPTVPHTSVSSSVSKKGFSIENSSSEEEPKTKPRTPTNTKAFRLKYWAYKRIEEELGDKPTDNAGDYYQLVKALKKLPEEEIKNMMEDALAMGKGQTVRGVFTDREIDLFKQNL